MRRAVGSAVVDLHPGIHWDAKRQRYIATTSLGFDGVGKRIVKRASGRTKTEAKNRLKEVLRETHVIPALGARKLRELSAEEVDRWLEKKSATLSTRSLQGIRACLNRAVNRAMARDKVKRNVVALCSIPQGKIGRPSKA